MVCGTAVASEAEMNATWQPKHAAGTWHPMGNRLGPVYYEHRISGAATGLFFVVTRKYYWLLRIITALVDLPVVGRFFVRVRSRMTVTYRGTWLHCHPRGDA